MSGGKGRLVVVALLLFPVVRGEAGTDTGRKFFVPLHN